MLTQDLLSVLKKSQELPVATNHGNTTRQIPGGSISPVGDFAPYLLSLFFYSSVRNAMDPLLSFQVETLWNLNSRDDPV